MQHPLLAGGLLTLFLSACTSTPPGEQPEPTSSGLVPVPAEQSRQRADSASWDHPEAARAQAHEDLTRQQLLHSIAPEAFADPDQILAAHLATTRIERLQLVGEVSLREVASTLAQLGEFSAVVHPEAEQAALDAGAVFDLELGHPTRIQSALDLVAMLAGPDVTWTVRHGVVLFTTGDRALGPSRTAIFHVGDLLQSVRSFPAPEMGVFPSDWDPEPEVLDEASVALYDEDSLLELIEVVLGPEITGQPGFSARISGGLLIVTYR